MLSKIIIHRVGNKINQENLFLSEEELQLEDEMKEILVDFFLKAFKTEEHFQFYHDSYLTNNAVYSAAAEIFQDTSTFIEKSGEIAKHLFEAADNPRVQGGDLFICYFAGNTDGESQEVDKIGIFKTENKNPFLKIYPENDNYLLEKDYGISLNKLDKGCIIYNSSKENGYALSVVDNNKNGDDYYWFEDFLKVKQRKDDYFHTQETLQIYKDYITKQLPQEFEVSRIDQANFLNKTLDFFKEKEQFDLNEFTQEVLQDEHVIESFSNYKTDYEQDMQVSIAEEFPISEAAVKKNQRLYKSVIKLDKNFHIYVHGDRKMIETGQDEKGKYYRLYFEEEK